MPRQLAWQAQEPIKAALMKPIPARDRPRRWFAPTGQKSSLSTWCNAWTATIAPAPTGATTAPQPFPGSSASAGGSVYRELKS
jgi:hypothetical protein